MRHGVEHRREHLERQPGALVRLKAHGKNSRKDGESRKNRHQRIQKDDGQRGQKYILVTRQITAEGDRDSHAETQREKGMSQSNQNTICGKF
ncbi:hypothetical protein SDC9_207327 [bioreactor metagenome]|uniref:Uncharacterized protein n=1 Tax=bioreactor metagenome TaxID=1076179 RepID=A0A645J850_9ZZZZ